MSDKESTDDARKSAIRAFREKEAREQRAAAEKQATEQNGARRRDQQRLSWATRAHQVVFHGVMAANEKFAIDGSPYAMSSGPDTSVDAVSYQVRRNGSPKIEATLTFKLNADGVVQPETSARGCENFPEPMAVDQVSTAWAEQAASAVLIAVLGGQRMRIPD